MFEAATRNRCSSLSIIAQFGIMAFIDYCGNGNADER
jgi:hypothetical protein